MPLESLAQAMNRISAEVRGGPLSRMARGGRVRMAEGGAVYDPMGSVSAPPSEGFAPSPAYENISDAIARTGAAVGRPAVGALGTAAGVYSEKSREAAAENEALRQQAMRNMQGELGYAGMPLGAGQMLLSQLGTATLPLTAAAKTAGYAATQATGNPRFGENVEFLSGFVDPSHVGMLKAAAPMAGAATRGAVKGVERQAISSAETSIKQVPALFKSKNFEGSGRNLDIGGGKYDLGTDYLRTERGVENHVYDPFNRSEEHNANVLAQFKDNPADTVTVANVLNVIAEPEARAGVIQQAYDNLQPGGKAYFDIYEGNRTGEGTRTSKGWQNNLKADAYLDEVRKVFPDAERKSSMIIATKPAEEVAVEAGARQSISGADHPAMINTRYPTGKKRIEEVEGERLVADLAAMKATPEMFENNVNLVKDYINMPEGLKAGTPDEIAEKFINHVKDNLIYLHDQVPENIRSRSQLWYDGARTITDDWAKEYGIPDSAVAGALAALSPQKDWYQNVSLAKRVLDVVKGGGDNFYNGFSFSPEMQKTYEGISSLNKPEYTPLFDQIKDRSLGDISKLDLPDDEKAILKAMWARLYDEAHNPKNYPIVTPEGGFGDMVKTSKGEDARVAWGSMNEIAKAIRAIEGKGDPVLLNDIMGGKHKVRNFYNNILAPNSSRGDVTIDTHAVAAGLFRPLSQKSVEVAHNFKTSAPKGMSGASGSAASGIQGTYPLYAEAYRRAAEERGILPRQMQSITWEAVRGLFPDKFKTPKNMAAVDALWNKYRTGEASIDETRQAISDLAGGVNPPTWFRPDGAPDEALRGAGDARRLPEPSVPRKAAGGAIRGAGAGSPREFASQERLLKLAAEHGLHRPQIAAILRQNDPRLSPVQATARAREIMAGDTEALRGILSDKLMADLRHMLKGARP